MRPARTVVLALTATLVVAGCGGGPTDQEQDVAFRNPVYDGNLPDPFVLRADGAWYAYGTQGRLGTMPVLRSDDLVTWEVVGDGMPTLAPWTAAGRHWAPEVVALGGRYLAYYTAMERETQQQCIGVAVADDPAGPFVDDAAVPLVCEHDEGGSIDASPFVDVDGTPSLLWKNDGNHVGVRSWIRVQRLGDDGLTLVGDGPVDLVTHDQPWEGHLVEGPTVLVRDGRYHLLYSANDYGSADYGVGWAVADALTGPWSKPSEEPLMRSSAEAAGPGHGTVVTTPGGDWYVHHAWPPDAVGAAYPGRQMWLTPLTWTAQGEPVLDGPTTVVDRLP
ncbi:glycoside hydrolase family 43 protein [Cellulomonas triticagri]|uniref:Glycoside hydrolase family 43 n=1 Tax=Cellulomonas triticagri TaxID=2483352 RepID=A0A3M2JKU6_9CELL|nr:glycoside hydrolase family 43 protein [Cellulomonas triticagri]RMI12781.1 glycoside hydrolase family 43 [Cellulomonas triticagri]